MRIFEEFSKFRKHVKRYNNQITLFAEQLNRCTSTIPNVQLKIFYFSVNVPLYIYISNFMNHLDTHTFDSYRQAYFQNNYIKMIEKGVRYIYNDLSFQQNIYIC
jgi:hypothetical protein